MQPEILIALPFLALAVGLGKGGLGGAFAGVITPITSIFIPVAEAVALLLPLFIVADWLAMRRYWGEWNTEELKWLSPLAIIGIVGGIYLLTNLPSDTLRLLLGILALVVGIYKILEPRLQQLHYESRRWHTVLAGGLAGMGAGIASSGGPIFTAYLLLQNLKPREFIATTVIFFAIVNLLRLPGMILTEVLEWDKLRVVVWFIPLVWVGVWMGNRLITRINQTLFNHLMTGLLIMAGIILVIR